MQLVTAQVLHSVVLLQVHTETQTHKETVHFESAVFLVFPVGGGQTQQSWHSQSQSARGNGAPHGTFMAGPAGGEEGDGACACVCVCIRLRDAGGERLHLKFHNICSIGSTIYATDAGVFTGSHCNRGLV